MTTADLLLQDFDLEIANTRRTLDRIPDRHRAWTPHEKSTTLGKLAIHCATLPLFGAYLLEDDGLDIAASIHPPTPLFTTREDTLVQLEQAAARCRAALVSATDVHLAQIFPFTFGEHILSHVARSLTFRYMCLNHLIHHTAQLGLYLRLLDISVPALYGPSADEQWTPLTDPLR